MVVAVMVVVLLLLLLGVTWLRSLLLGESEIRFWHNLRRFIVGETPPKGVT